MASYWNGSISATTRPIAMINTSIQSSIHCASNRENRGEKALQTSDIHGKTWRKASCQLSKTNVNVLGLWNSYKARSSRVDRLLLPRNFVHGVQGDPGYHNNRKSLLFVRRPAAAADRPEKRALFFEVVNFERTLQLEFTADFHKWGISI